MRIAERALEIINEEAKNDIQNTPVGKGKTLRDYQGKAGIYQISKGKDSYIGWSNDIARRIGEHFKPHEVKRAKKENYSSGFRAACNSGIANCTIKVLELTSDESREEYWIEKKQPSWNTNKGRG